MNNKSKKTSTKEEVKAPASKQCLPLYGGFGIMIAFVFVSIVYSTAMVMLSLGQRFWVGLVPQVLFAAWVFIVKFSSK